MPTARLPLSVTGLLMVWALPAAAGTVFSSQLGHAPGDPMTAVLAVPAGSAVQQTFSVTNAANTVVFSATPVAYPGGWTGNDTAGDTYLLDFTTANLGAGTYRVSSNGAVSAPFTVSTNIYDLTRFKPLEFFRIQLSGGAYTLTAMDGTKISHNPDHRDDARQATRRDKGGGDSALIQQDALALPGGRKDVTGGWADAGDYNKYMGNTPWAAYLLLLTLEQNTAYWSAVDDDRNGNPDIREVTRPALDWMLKMQHTDGSIYERVFNGYGALFDGRPDLETDNISGNSDDRPLDTDRYADITAKSTYAWAAGSRIFGDAGYLNAAVRAWDWAFANQTRVKAKVYGGGLYFGDVEIGLTLGAIEIHLAQVAAGLTPDPKYLQYATARVQAHLNAGDWINPSSWDSQQSQVLMRYHTLASPNDKSRIVAQLKGRWDAGIALQSRNAYRMNDEWRFRPERAVGLRRRRCALALSGDGRAHVLRLRREPDGVDLRPQPFRRIVHGLARGCRVHTLAALARHRQTCGGGGRRARRHRPQHEPPARLHRHRRLVLRRALAEPASHVHSHHDRTVHGLGRGGNAASRPAACGQYHGACCGRRTQGERHRERERERHRRRGEPLLSRGERQHGQHDPDQRQQPERAVERWP